MKNINKIVLLIALSLGFTACNDGGGDTTTTTTTETTTPSDPWDPTNISGTPTGNTTDSVVDSSTGDSSTGDSGDTSSITSPTQASAIPFPTLPTNIALDPKYIPPQ